MPPTRSATSSAVAAGVGGSISHFSAVITAVENRTSMPPSSSANSSAVAAARLQVAFPSFQLSLQLSKPAPRCRPPGARPAALSSPLARSLPPPHPQLHVCFTQITGV